MRRPTPLTIAGLNAGLIARLVACVGVFLLSLSGCSLAQQAPPPTPTVIIPTTTATPLPSPTPSPTPEVVGGALTIWHSWSESDLPGLVQIIDGFRQQYPETLFDVLYLPPQELQARFEAEARQGRGPHLLLGPAEWGPALYDAGLIADITGMISQENLNSLNKPALAAARSGETLIGAPYAVQGVVLYRNKDIITISPDTFEDLVALAQNSTQGEVIGAYLERSFYFSGAHLLGLGGRLIDDNGAPAFNTPEGEAWIGLLKRFDEAGPTNFFGDDDVERFKAGTVGWIIDGTWNMRALAAALGPEKVAIDPWPTYENGRLSGFITAENLYLNAANPGESPLTVRTFLNYFLSHEAQTRLGETGRIPSISGVTLTDSIMGPLTAQAMSALAGGVAYPGEPAASIYNLNLDNALRSIFENGAPPDQALGTAAQLIQASAAEATSTPTP
jgi:arabinogalactan oligomer/maltooligosaccharide transport system substrate-binding protein